MEQTWQQELAEILRLNNVLAAKTSKGNPRRRVSALTQEARDHTLYRGFRSLRKLGIRLKSVRDFRENHMKSLAMHWESEGLSSSTIQNRISVFRTFADWIDKRGMIRESEMYVKNKESVRRKYAAQEDKSWSAMNVDPFERIGQIVLYDKYVAMQLRIIEAFGLRRREAIMLKPHRADKGDSLYISEGSKGRRDRHVPIKTIHQRQALDDAKEFVGPNARNRSLADPTRTLEQAITRFQTVLNKFGLTKAELGVTAHGLRSQYINDRFKTMTGVEAPIRGGGSGIGTDVSAIDAWSARAAISEEVGHSRPTIFVAYGGGGHKRPRRVA